MIGLIIFGAIALMILYVILMYRHLNKIPEKIIDYNLENDDLESYPAFKDAVLKNTKE